MARILLIEDDDDVRNMLRVLLEDEGYDVVEAADGRVGIKLYKEVPADVIITDIIMPEKEGIETIMELQRDFPDSKIIAVSGGGSRLNGESCLELARSSGAQQVFTKPIDVDELLTTLRDMVDS
jgi:CheY-like chemotaxis protein